MTREDTPWAETEVDAGAAIGVAFGGSEEGDALERRVAREKARKGLFGMHAPLRIDRFTVLHEVGRGGMGVVFAAYDPELDRRVAIKVVSSRRAEPTEEKERSDADDAAVAEARAMAKVSDPNVVAVYEVGRHAPTDGPAGVFVAMEFIEGKTLRQWVADERPSPEQIVATYLDAARGLGAVHAAGLVHRDFKPDNVMLGDDGRVRVMDFGIARTGIADETTDADGQTTNRVTVIATATGAVAGTPAYMAPERFAGRPAEPRSDQFAWCLSLYEALYGGRPYRVASVAELCAAMLGEDPVPPPPVDPDVPAYVRAALIRGLAKDAADRFPSMSALITALTPAEKKRHLPRIGAGVLVAGAVSVFALRSAGQSTELCSGAEAEIAATWNDDRAAAVGAAFAKQAAPYAEATGRDVVESLRAYAAGWAEQYTQACAATHLRGEQSEETMNAQLACLQRRRTTLDAIVGEFVRVDADGVDQAHSIVEALDEPSQCRTVGFADPLAVTPDDPKLREQAAQIERDKARVAAALEFGRTEAAFEGLNALLDQIEGAGDPDLLAGLRALEGKVLFVRGDLDGSIDAVQRSYAQARLAKRPELTIEAALETASLIGSMPKGGQTAPIAQHWLDLASLESEVSGHSLPLKADEVRARLLSHAGDKQGSIALTEKVVAQLEQECGECGALVARYRELSGRRIAVGDRDGATQAAERALAVARSLYPADHPKVAGPMADVASCYSAMGRHEGAESMLRRALELRTRALGSEHPNTAAMRSELVRILDRLGRADEAIEEAKLVVQTYEGADLPLAHASALQQLGDQYRGDGQNELAREAYMASLAIFERDFPQGHPRQPIVMWSLTSALKRLGRFDEALSLSHRTLEAAESHGEPTPQERTGYVQNIATASRDAGKLDEAMEWSLRAVELARTLPPVPLRVVPYLTLAGLQRASDEDLARRTIAEAVGLCRDAETRRRALGRCDDVDKLAADLGAD